MPTRVDPWASAGRSTRAAPGRAWVASWFAVCNWRIPPVAGVAVLVIVVLDVVAVVLVHLVVVVVYIPTTRKGRMRACSMTQAKRHDTLAYLTQIIQTTRILPNITKKI